MEAKPVKASSILSRAKGSLVSRVLTSGKNTIKKTARHLARNAVIYAITGAAAVAGYGSKAMAEAEHHVYPYMNVPTINQVIEDANAGDTINFTYGEPNGVYQQFYQEYYNFLGNRNYTLEDGVVLRGWLEDQGIIINIDGNDINISGNATLENSLKGIAFGEYNNNYNNITIDGITFESIIWATHLYDRKYSQPLTQAATVLTGCQAHNCEKMVAFTATIPGITNCSPYASVVNSTLINIGTSSNSPAIDIPKWWDAENEKFIMLGNDEILNLVLINCHSMSKSGDWIWFESPKNVLQDPNVTEIYENEPNNCRVEDDMKFVPGTIIPRRFQISPLVLDPNIEDPNNYIGAEKPLKIEDLNLDGLVNFIDYAILVNEINDVNFAEIQYLCEDWLKEDPNNIGRP